MSSSFPRKNHESISNNDEAEDRHDIMVIPINLGKPSLRLRLEAYYQWVSPQQLEPYETWKDRFAQIWKKYGGTVQGEDQLARKLHKKYGTQIFFQLTHDEFKVTKTTKVKHQQQYTEEWYELRSQHECTSGIVDFTSPGFDPFAALQQPAHVVAEINPKAFTEQQRLERVDQFRSLLPTCDPQYRIAPPAVHSTVRRTAKVSLQEPASSCWDSTVEPSYSLLYRAMHSKQQIRIVVRDHHHINGIRGIVTGQLMAYDKHFNLLLQNAYETYSSLSVCKEERPVDREIARRARSHHQQQRSLPQVLIRGDTVVLVSWASLDEPSRSVISSRYRIESLHQQQPEEK